MWCDMRESFTNDKMIPRIESACGDLQGAIRALLGEDVMTKKFDHTKPVRTRDGRPARIICTDAEGLVGNYERPIIAIVGERIRTYTDGGFFYLNQTEGPHDLVNVQERIERFYGVSSIIGRLGPSCATAEDARKDPWERKILPVIRIAYEDGQPVEVELIHGED